MRIAVRLDDITPDMDWERFFRFKALLDCYQVKPLIGVVPDNRDENLMKARPPEAAGNRKDGKALPAGGGKEKIPEDFWAYVKELKKQGWVIAMHGLHHVYSTDKGGLFPLNNFSEFAGVPYERQKEMLMEGKRRLAEKGIDTDIFMAPAHSYDNHTLRALKEAGFTCLTDGFGSMPYYWKGLKFYPISFQLGSTLKKSQGYSTMVVHTDTVSEEDLKRYKGYLESKESQWISYREYLAQPGKKRGILGRWKEYILAKGKYFLVKLKS